MRVIILSEKKFQLYKIFTGTYVVFYVIVILFLIS